MFHDFKRKDLYNVSTESLIRRELRLINSIWPWNKSCEVYEYAVYECVGEHPTLMGWFSFMEWEHTDSVIKFASRELAKQYIEDEGCRTYDHSLANC
jgi:hypothetical protein